MSFDDVLILVVSLGALLASFRILRLAKIERECAERNQREAVTMLEEARRKYLQVFSGRQQ